MTHFIDDPVHIKVEPISPSDASYQLTIPGHYQVHGQFSPNFEIADLAAVVEDMAVDNEDLKSEESLTPALDAREALKLKIQADRRARGQEELVVNFEPHTKSELTSQEIRKRERRKEQNRRAAQKCRIKKRALQAIAQEHCSTLVQQNEDLKHTNTKLKVEVKKYRELLDRHTNSGQCKLVPHPSRTPSTSFHCQSPAHQLPVATTSSSLHPSTSQAPISLDELQELASINQIAKELELGALQNINSPPLEVNSTAATTTIASQDPFNNDLSNIQDLLPTDPNLDNFQDLSYLTPQDWSSNVNTSSGQFSDPSEDLLKENGEKSVDGLDELLDILQNNAPKPRGVRNLNQEFAQCANQPDMSVPSITSERVSDIPSLNMPFCSSCPQFLPTSPDAMSQTVLSRSTNPDHLMLGNTGLTSSHLAYNESFPISPISSCTSPPSASSPSFFQSPSEPHQCSPGAMGCQEASSPQFFRFPPDPRFPLQS